MSSIPAPRLAGLLLLAAAAAGALACSSAEPADDAPGVAEARQVAHASSIVRRPDGLYDVTCLDGRHEVATVDEILANTICARPAPWEDGHGGTDAGVAHDGGGWTGSDASPPPHDAGSGASACGTLLACEPGHEQWSLLGCPSGTGRRNVCSATICRYVTVWGDPVTSGYDGPCQPF